MTLWMPKKKPLYAPMLATFGGGSVRGFRSGGEQPYAGGLRLHLDGKQDISSNNLTVTDYNNDIGTNTSQLPYNNGETSMYFFGKQNESALVIPNVMSNSTASTPWCVEFWYYLSGQPQTDSPLAFNSTASGGNDMTILFGYGVGIASIGTVGMDLYTVNWGTYPLSASTWIHFCLSCDGAGRVNFWLDGQYQSTFTGVTMSDFSQSTLVVGNEADSTPIRGSANLFPGYIADVRVWDIDAYAAAGVGNFTPATSLTSHPYQTM